MIVLNPTDTLQIVLNAAKTANDMDVVVIWRDVTTSAYTPGSSLTNSNGVTDVNICTAPASSTQRVIDFISVFNKDTALKTITIKIDVSATEKILRKIDIAPDGLVTYVDGSGWEYIPPTPQGYAISVQALTSSPADTTPFYFGTKPAAITTTAGQNKIYIRKAGTLKIAEIYTYAGTAGTAENVSMYVRVNNTTDYLIQTVGVAASERVFTNSALTIALAVGDYIEIKCIPPIWATNPLTFIVGGYVYIE